VQCSWPSKLDINDSYARIVSKEDCAETLALKWLSVLNEPFDSFGGFMATTIRMQRHGNKHRPFYHIVAANSRASATKKFLEKIGYYDPAPEKSTFVVKQDRLQYWYGVGATLSNTMKVLLNKNGVKLERVKTASQKPAGTAKVKKAKPAKTAAAPKSAAPKVTGKESAGKAPASKTTATKAK
jgi:small subunit ribosomal protein S16